MSKAFTRESDDAPESAPPVRPRSALPPGVPNYLTASGARRLREELAQRNATREAQRTQGSSDRRIAQLEHALRTCTIATPPDPPWNQVRFGATVRVRDSNGDEDRFRIVGVDETDLDSDSVSWLSPIAKALLHAQLGQRVRFRVPAGEREVEIVSIAYE